MKTQTVLFVVYDFPPEGARGTKRSVKFVQHLPESGWAPVVLTARDQQFDFYDGSMMAEVSESVPVYRARTFEGVFHRNDYKPNEVRDPVADAKKAPPSFLRRTMLRVYRGIGKFTSVPDSRILWFPCAVAKGLRVIRRHQCRVIYSSGPSHTNHVVAAFLSRVSGLPLVIDFRDAWVGNPAGKLSLKQAHTWLERWCVRRASFVICTTQGMKEDFAQRYPSTPGKWVTITNGFDPADFPAPGSNPSSNGVLKLVHAGTLGGERSPKEFLMALGQLSREIPDLASKLQVIFVGKNSPFTDGRRIEEYVEQYGCGPLVQLTGYVSRKASLDYVQNADALLLIIGRVPKAKAFVYGISGKIYDYAAARRPVLSVTEPGSSAEMVEHLRLGPIVHPDEPAQIKDALIGLLQAQANGQLKSELDVQALKKFEFSNLTARLADCLDQATGSKRRANKAKREEASICGRTGEGVATR